jgi:hypothetical protein
VKVIQNVEGKACFRIGDAGWEETLSEQLDVLLNRPRTSTEVDVMLENAGAVNDGHCDLLNDVFLQFITLVGVQIHYIFPIVTLMLIVRAGLSSMANVQCKSFTKQ